MTKTTSQIATGVSALVLALTAAPVAAQEDVDAASLDSLSEAAESTESALATAAEQEADGDLLGAASTLERALLNRPEADDVRLAYATVLCKVDDKESARIEIGALRLRPTTGDAWRQMLEACGEEFNNIARRTGRIGGTMSAGIAYQEDAYGEVNAFSYFLPPSVDGLAFVANAQINARVPAGGAFFYSDIYAQNHTAVSGQGSDYQIGDLTVGFGTETDSSEFSGGALVRHGRIAGDKYFTAVGGEINAVFRAGGNGRISLRGEAVSEDYILNDIDGWHYSVQAGYQWFPTLAHSFSIAAGFETKDAEFDVFGYDAYSVAAAARFPLGEGGAYGKMSATLRYVDFHNMEFFDDRHETRIYTRAAIGVPLVKRSLFLEAGTSYRTRDYNLYYYNDYNSWGGDLQLVWNF